MSLDDLAEDLGTNWRELGRILGIQENKLEYFDTKNERLRDKGMAMLVEWMKRRADATVGKTGMEGLFKADEGTYSYGTELKESIVEHSHVAMPYRLKLALCIQS